MLGFEMVEQIASSPSIRRIHPFTQLADHLLELFLMFCAYCGGRDTPPGGTSLTSYVQVRGLVYRVVHMHTHASRAYAHAPCLYT